MTYQETLRQSLLAKKAKKTSVGPAPEQRQHGLVHSGMYSDALASKSRTGGANSLPGMRKQGTHITNIQTVIAAAKHHMASWNSGLDKTASKNLSRIYGKPPREAK